MADEKLPLVVLFNRRLLPKDTIVPPEAGETPSTLRMTVLSATCATPLLTAVIPTPLLFEIVDDATLTIAVAPSLPTDSPAAPLPSKVDLRISSLPVLPDDGATMMPLPPLVNALLRTVPLAPSCEICKPALVLLSNVTLSISRASEPLAVVPAEMPVALASSEELRTNSDDAPGGIAWMPSTKLLMTQFST